MASRHYDPKIGRFIQPDTIVADAKSTPGWARYVYVENDPVNFVDPTGHRRNDKTGQLGAAMSGGSNMPTAYAVAHDPFWSNFGYPELPIGWWSNGLQVNAFDEQALAYARWMGTEGIAKAVSIYANYLTNNAMVGGDPFAGNQAAGVSGPPVITTSSSHTEVAGAFIVSAGKTKQAQQPKLEVTVRHLDPVSGTPKDGAAASTEITTRVWADYDDKTELVTVIHVEITAQTIVGAGTHLEQRASYGRGTTDEDKKTGNISLGFHEQQHHEDVGRYVKENPFKLGRVPASEAHWQQQTKLLDRVENQIDAYRAGIEHYTFMKTDCVGIKARGCPQ